MINFSLHHFFQKIFIQHLGITEYGKKKQKTQGNTPDCRDNIWNSCNSARAENRLWNPCTDRHMAIASLAELDRSICDWLAGSPPLEQRE